MVYVLNILLILILGVMGVFKMYCSKNVIIFGAYFVLSAVWDVGLELCRDTSSPEDFLEILRPIGFLLFFQYYRYSNVRLDIVESQTIKLLYWTFSLLGIYCILEFLFPSVFQPISFFLWKRQAVGVLHNKAVASFFQTYNSAYAFMIPYFLGLIKLIRRISLWNILFFFLMLLTLLLTQSKSMYVAAAIGSIACLWIATDFKSAKSTARSIVYVGTLALVIGILFLTYQEEIGDSLKYALNGLEEMSRGESRSLGTRSAQLEWAIDNNYIGFIGLGVGKSQILLESLYALYYYRYGIIGICLVLGLIFYSSYCSYKVSLMKNIRHRVLYEALFVFFLINPLALTSSCHQDMPKTSLIFYGMVGLIFNRYNFYKTINKPIESTN